MGQGTIADREGEFLGESDAGIVLLRKIYWREMDALRSGKPMKAWKRLVHDADMNAPTAAE
jgi:5,5'-dehydrodivanillate O-demethylase